VPALCADDLAVWERLVDRVLEAPEAGGIPGPGPVDAASIYAGPTVEVACLGALRLRIDGVAANVDRLQPRVRALLCVLAVHAGNTIHRDQLIGALWPEEDRSATRNLQVAVSSLRKFFDAERPGAGVAVARRGEGYTLELGNGEADVPRFEEAARAGRLAAVAGDGERAAGNFATALGFYAADLLIDEGSPEWLVEERERLRQLATDTTEGLATRRLESGDPSGALDAAWRGLRLDRYRDRLWRTVVAANEQAGDLAAAGRATVEYQAVLAELGVAHAAG
jgi:DNA-binding SARP family transcriptional activator